MIGRLIAVTATGLMVMIAAAVSAQENGTAAPNGNTNQPAMTGQGRMGMMGGMDHAQMQRMMDNCNRMMESHMQKDGPQPEKKG